MFNKSRQPVCNLEPIQNALVVNETDALFQLYDAAADDFPPSALADLLQRIASAPGPTLPPPPPQPKKPAKNIQKPGDKEKSKDIRGFFKPQQ